VSRDRDPSGRPRNSRPRDALGRPLRRGAAGEPAIPDVPALPPSAALAEAQRLIDAGRPFHAHEVLEAAWKAAPAPERGLWQGLAQLAVGLTHARRGNAKGAVVLLRRGADRIRPYGPAPAPDDPAPDDPAPGGPAPDGRAPVDPAPSDPAPSDRAPGDPAPGDVAERYGLDVARAVTEAEGLAERIEHSGLDGLPRSDLSPRLLC
jgi:uncharacterized protein